MPFRKARMDARGWRERARKGESNTWTGYYPPPSEGRCTGHEPAPTESGVGWRWEATNTRGSLFIAIPEVVVAVAEASWFRPQAGSAGQPALEKGEGESRGCPNFVRERERRSRRMRGGRGGRRPRSRAARGRHEVRDERGGGGGWFELFGQALALARSLSMQRESGLLGKEAPWRLCRGRRCGRRTHRHTRARA